MDRRAEAILPKAVAWRRDLHQNPELGNREVRTAKVVADHLRALGLEVKTGVAKTGVVGVLGAAGRGRWSPCARTWTRCPVTEEVDLPFASKARTQWTGRETGVMHACGHDMHMAILMGVAEVLAGMRASLPGTVKFIFQPAEEGAPPASRAAREVMIEEGVLEAPKVDAIFGLHVFPIQVGHDRATARGHHGRRRHARRSASRDARPTAPCPGPASTRSSSPSQIVLGLQTVVEPPDRTSTTAPAVVTVGMIHGGIRSNIIPDEVKHDRHHPHLRPGDAGADPRAREAHRRRRRRRAAAPAPRWPSPRAIP